MDEAVHFIDASVPMYAVGADCPLRAPCAAIMRAIGRGELNAMTDTEVLQEILHQYVSPGDRQRAVQVVADLVVVVPAVAAVTNADVQAAMDLIAEHERLPVRDAIHASVMRRHGVERIISADRHFDVVPGLKRIDPLLWS